MYTLSKLIGLERILVKKPFETSKQVFESIGECLAADIQWLTTCDLMDRFAQREKLGTTCIGHGVAIPHLRIDNLSKPVGAIVQLENGIEFGQKETPLVDLFFSFIVPTSEHELHLEILAMIAEKLSVEHNRKLIKNANSREEIYSYLKSSVS